MSATGELLKIYLEEAMKGSTSNYMNESVDWVYQSIYGGFQDFLSGFNNYASAFFELNWVDAIVQFVQWFGMILFAIGFIVAIAEFAIDYQEGRSGVKNTALNIFKGWLAVSLFTTLPIELYKYCIYAQDLLADGITEVFGQSMGIAGLMGSAFNVVSGVSGTAPGNTILVIIEMIAFIFCIFKIFFANVKRGGILLTQIAVGSLYMFSIPRGYQDAFWGWCKQVIGTCFTAFMQTTLLYLGLLTVNVNAVLGLGVMLSAAEVPKIAQAFGMDTSIRGNMTSAIYATSSAINLVRTIKTMI